MGLENEVLFSPIPALVVSTPEELKERIKELKANRRFKSRYVTVSVNDDAILVRLFKFKDLAVKELGGVLTAEAADLLSMAEDEIEVDYQVFLANEEWVEGVFMAAPRELVQNYLAEIDRARLIPVCMTSSLIASLEYFLIKTYSGYKRCGVLDFSQDGTIQCAVIDKRKCRFLRKVKYENPDEALRGTVQSLQSASADSDVKEYDTIYMIGNPVGKDRLAGELKQKFQVDMKTGEFHPEAGLNSWNRFLNLNLFRKYVFSVRTRNLILISSYMVVFALLLQSMLLVIEIRSLNINLRISNLSLEGGKYEYAQELLQKLLE